MMVAAGILVVTRSGRMAVMSSRYDSPAGAPGRQTPSEAAGTGQPGGTGQPAGTQAPAGTPEWRPADSASIWESLSRGEDPTSAGSRHP
jgi:hypothetical protein